MALIVIQPALARWSHWYELAIEVPLHLQAGDQRVTMHWRVFNDSFPNSGFQPGQTVEIPLNLGEMLEPLKAFLYGKRLVMSPAVHEELHKLLLHLRDQCHEN